jgi:hypothetical protein
MTFEDLQFYYNLCNPDEALPPHDARNVDLDAMGPKDALVRGQNWAGTLANIVRRAQGSVANPPKQLAQPVCRIFTALPGSGKSTELLRLAEHLRKSVHGRRFLPVYIDAEEVLDLTSPVDVPDVRLATLLKVTQAVSREEGVEQDKVDAVGEGVVARVWRTFTGIDPAKAELGMNLGLVSAKLVADMKANPSLRGQVRNHVAAQLTTFNESIDTELRALNARAQAQGFVGIVVLFDSLEKLRGISSNWSAVLDSAERIFADGARYLRLPIHVIYTIPPAVFLRLNDPSVLFMPMIKLRDRAGTPFQPGMDAALELVRRRIPEPMLADLFGKEQVADRLRRLIEWSGGYPREIIRLLQTLLTEDESDYPLGDKAFRRLLSSAGDSYRRIISNTAVDWLAKVAVLHDISIEDDDHRETVDHMLSNNIVLRYQNETEWFDVHPAVREDRRVLAAIGRVAPVQ